MPITDHSTSLPRIGPGSDPAGLIEAARAEARRSSDDEATGRVVAWRLFIAFLVCSAIALACFVLVPHWLGVVVPGWVPLLSFLAILGGTVATTPPEPTRTTAEEDKGRPVCCPGPRCLSVPRDVG